MKLTNKLDFILQSLLVLNRKVKVDSGIFILSSYNLKNICMEESRSSKRLEVLEGLDFSTRSQDNAIENTKQIFETNMKLLSINKQALVVLLI